VRRGQLRLIAIAPASAAVAKHRESFVVGRLLEAFDKEIAHAMALGDDRAQDSGGHDRPVLAARQSSVDHSDMLLTTHRLARPNRRVFPACLTQSVRISDERPCRAIPRERRFSREQRRAFKRLADAPRGVNEEVLVVAHGFSAELLAGLVLAGLATVVTETKRADRGLTIEVERIRITAAGRRALEG
jgi:hypothetical protein